MYITRYFAVMFCAALAMTTFAYAADPAKPIRIIVSTSPGGGADVTARTIEPALSELLGQTVIVENRPGASGMIAGDYVARQPADGHTFLFDITTFAVNPSLYAKMPYVPLKDLVPVTEIVQAPNVLVVHPSVPVSTMNEFIAYAKAKDGALAYASSGNGSSQHLTAELFKMRTGIKMTHVPYKGGGPALADVVAGHVPVFFAFLSSAAPHIKAGRLKAIAVSSVRRSPMIPDVPTIAESGLPGFSAYDFNGLYAAAGTPKDAISRMQGAVAKALARPEIRAKFVDIGAETVGSTPQAFEVFLRGETEKWAEVIKAGHITIE